ncbi:uncharacterized protein LOC143715650 [Siphateles boraxobius]|uniref:uncharacterized protein LOC143715650 n=1 Tax=Siphateles boraxobius TaxID=180520 RepID=UPI004062FFFC
MEAAASQPTSSTSPSPLAEVITSLAALHHEHHQALVGMRSDLERRFELLVQGQQEDRERFRSWMDREVQTASTPPPAECPHLAMTKMGSQDDPEVFLDLFEKAAEAGGWPKEHWPVRLIPLLSGEAQAAAQQLPVQNLLIFDDLKRAILQRVGRSPEQHRQRFRSLDLGDNGRPFVMAQQFRDSCRKWLLAEGSDVEKIIDRVVLEQFIARLPKILWRRISWWRAPGSAIPSLMCLSPLLFQFRPPLPPHSDLSHSLGVVRRVRSEGHPGAELGWRWTPPRGPPRGVTSAGAESSPPGSMLSPRQSFGPLPATRAAGRPGPACWRGGDPDHFIDRCPMMDIGTMIRVPDVQQAAHDQDGRYQIP